jgi:enoyl-CoA hydratase
VSQTDTVWTITLNRPEVLNRFDATQEEEFIDVLTRLEDSSSTRVGVLLAEGSVFSAGGDFDLMLEAQRDLVARNETLDRGRRLLAQLLRLTKPLVVGLQGGAVGLGSTIVAAADIVVAARSAWLADTHVGVGLVAGDGGSLFWPQAIGMLRARRYLLTGDRITAPKAYEFGLVTDLVDEPESVRAEAVAIAERVAALPPLAVQGTKRALNQISHQRAGEVAEAALAFEGATMGSQDLVEAVTAFREKREGRFEGR